MARTVGRGVDTQKETIESIKEKLVKTKKMNEELEIENTELKAKLEKLQENNSDMIEDEEVQYIN